MRIKSDKEHFLSCNVAAFTYNQGCEVFSQLKVGKKIRLVREDENPYDHNAVAIFFGDTQFFLYTQLYRQAVCIPAGFTFYIVSFLRFVYFVTNSW